jgi:lipopolysaccharide biosynthesis regulator YciM
MLAKGADFDPSCARVNLVGGKIELAAKRYREVKRRLRKARSQDPDLASETLDLFRQACDEQADESGYREYLKECLTDAPVLPVVDVLADYLERDSGAETARSFVVEQLLRNPSLGGFVLLLDRLQRDGEPLPAEQLALLRRFSQSLLAKQFGYRCNECGYSGHSLIWLCPSCRSWGSVKPIVHRELK